MATDPSLHRRGDWWEAHLKTGWKTCLVFSSAPALCLLTLMQITKDCPTNNPSCCMLVEWWCILRRVLSQQSHLCNTRQGGSIPFNHHSSTIGSIKYLCKCNSMKYYIIEENLFFTSNLTHITTHRVIKNYVALLCSFLWRSTPVWFTPFLAGDWIQGIFMQKKIARVAKNEYIHGRSFELDAHFRGWSVWSIF